MNEKSSTTNMELPFACVSGCVPCAVVKFLMVKNKIHKQLTEVYGSDVMSVQMVSKWCWKFCEGQYEVHDELRTSRPKVATDESVNLIHMIVNEDYPLTLRELETIMNDDCEDPLSQMSISLVVTNLGTQFYQSSVKNWSGGTINAWIFLATMWKNDVFKRNKI